MGKLEDRSRLGTYMEGKGLWRRRKKSHVSLVHMAILALPLLSASFSSTSELQS